MYAKLNIRWAMDLRSQTLRLDPAEIVPLIADEVADSAADNVVDDMAALSR